MKIALHNLQENCLPDHVDCPGPTHTCEVGFRCYSAAILCLAAISLMAAFFAFNFLEQNYNMLPALVAASVLPILALFRLGQNQKAPLLLFLCAINFIALSCYTFVLGNAADGSALVWFLLVPPLVIFSMSRRMAVCLLFISLFALAALLFIWQGQSLGQQLSLSLRARFMTYAVLSFFFLSIAEYMRSRAARAFAHAMDRARLLASTDPLTGIGNRRDFYNHLKWLQAQSERSGELFSVALLDIDNFKHINKVYGRKLGDALLRHVTRTTNDALRETDRVFRWGGGKFAVILPGIDLHDACPVLERVRRHVEDSPMILINGTSIEATVSVGLDTWNRRSSLDGVMANADSRLYLAKKLGKNRVYTGAVNQAVEWFPRLRALPRMAKSPSHALVNFPTPAALPARV